jgi:hypothetical protein
MKYALPIVQLAFGVGLFLTAISRIHTAVALDRYGCHNNRKAGGYHCHRGPLAGQSFPSQDEMLKKFASEKPATDANNKRKQ